MIWRTARSSSPTRRSIPIPTPEQVAETAIGAARHVRRFGLVPKVALCSHSPVRQPRHRLGPPDARGARRSSTRASPDFAYEGEMHVDAALDPDLRARIFPNSRMEGAANVLSSPHRRGLGRAQHPQDEGRRGSRSGRS
jgi:phosphotransacetylase